MATKTQPAVEISETLLDSIHAFPLARRVEHCGEAFSVSPLAIYATCPRCGDPVKLRAFAATIEVADVMDAVLMWLKPPEAQELARRRQFDLQDDG